MGHSSNAPFRKFSLIFWNEACSSSSDRRRIPGALRSMMPLTPSPRLSRKSRRVLAEVCRGWLGRGEKAVFKKTPVGFIDRPRRTRPWIMEQRERSSGARSGAEPPKQPEKKGQARSCPRLEIKKCSPGQVPVARRDVPSNLGFDGEWEGAEPFGSFPGDILPTGKRTGRNLRVESVIEGPKGRPPCASSVTPPLYTPRSPGSSPREVAIRQTRPRSDQ